MSLTKGRGSSLRGLILGDAAVILVVTLFGFVNHGESLASPRWLTTFLPVCAAWGLQSPWLGLYRKDIVCNPKQVWWRAILAMLLGAPMAAFLRGLMLDSAVIPVFVAVLGSISAAGMALWRIIYALIISRPIKHG